MYTVVSSILRREALTISECIRRVDKGIDIWNPLPTLLKKNVQIKYVDYTSIFCKNMKFLPRKGSTYPSTESTYDVSPHGKIKLV